MKKYLMIQSCFFTIRHKNDKVEINKKEIMKGLDQIGQIAVPLTDIEKAITAVMDGVIRRIWTYFRPYGI